MNWSLICMKMSEQLETAMAKQRTEVRVVKFITVRSVLSELVVDFHEDE